MNNLKKYLLIIIVIITSIISKSITMESTTLSLAIKIIVILITPVILIYIALKYSKPGKAKKYRIISFSTAGVWFYITIINTYIEKKYVYFFTRYSKIFSYIEIGSLFVAVFVAGLCLQKIKSEESKYI